MLPLSFKQIQGRKARHELKALPFFPRERAKV